MSGGPRSLLSLAPGHIGGNDMDLIAKLRAERGELMDKAKALCDLGIKEKRDLTDEEFSSFEELRDKANDLQKQIAALEVRHEAQLQLCRQHAELDNPSPAPTVPPTNPSRSDEPNKRTIVPATARSHTRLKAFTGPNGGEQAYRAGQFLRAVVWSDREARNWCDQNGIAIRAMSSTTNTAGGAVIFDEFRNTIIDLAEQYGVFRQNAEVVPMGSDTLEWPRVTGGLTTYFVAENTAPTESNPTFDSVSLVAKELATLTLVPKTLSDDSVISLADLVARKIALAMATKEDQCGFIGDGTSTYGGMHGVSIKINDGNHAGSLVTSAEQAFSALIMTEFESMIGKLPDFAGLQPAWYISKVGWAASMMRLADAAGGNTKEDIEGGHRNTFLGYPVVFSQTLNKNLDDRTSEILLLLGDLSMAATMGDRRTLTVEADGGGKYFEKRQTAILGVERFDINVHDLGDATNAGPIVAMKSAAA